MNWFPVEYEGTLRWEDHSTVFDNDYQWNIQSKNDDLALVTRGREGKGVHVEFDSTETVNDWDGTNTWWEDFHHNVVDKNDKVTIQNQFGSKFAILIGMLGLDVYHGDHHSELHPAYAMFIRMPGQSVTANVRWTFFVRNWGNEGFCGPGDEPLPNTRQIRVRIPDQTLLAWNGWVYAHGLFSSIDECFSQSQVALQQTSDGTLFIFDLPDASKRCGFVGDFTMKGRPLVIGGGSASSASSFATGAVGASDEDEHQDEDPVLRAKVARLTPSARRELDKQLLNLMSESRSGAIIPIAPTLPDYSKDLKAVENPAFQAEQEKKRRLIDAFLKAQGID